MEVGDILQIIDAAAGTVVNRLAINTPLLRGSVSANASFEVRSERRETERERERERDRERWATPPAEQRKSTLTRTHVALHV